MKKRLLLQILIPFLALILVSVGVVSLVSYVVSVNTTMQVLTQNISQRMEQTNRTFDMYFQDTENIVTMLAKADEFARYEQQRLQMTNTLEAFQDSGAYFGTAKGEYFSVPEWTDKPKDYDPRQRPWYEKAVQNKGNVIWTDPYIDANSGNQVVLTAAKAVYQGERLIGVVAIDVTPTELINIVKEIKIGDSGYAVLMDANGIILYHPDEKMLGTDMSKDKILQGMTAKGQNGELQYDFNGETKIMSFVTNKVTGWKLLGSVSVDELAERAGVIFDPMLITILILLAIAVLISLYLARRITKPIHQLARSVEEVEKGNLSIEITTTRQDEIGLLSQKVGSMVIQNREIIGRIQQYAEEAADSAEKLSDNISVNHDITSEIHTSMEQVAAGANQQQQQMEEGLRAIEEMTLGMQKFAETSGVVAEASFETAQNAEHGSSSIEQATRQMGMINESVHHAAETVQQLGKRSQEIGEIVETITAIASQTNLLSLNAAIEAARAGEQGKGFAIVAGEVRKLAEQSAESAKRIAQLIQEIQSETTHAIHSMEVVSRNAEEGSVQVERSGAIFDTILTQIKRVSDQIGSVTAISEEMSASSEEMLAATDETGKIARRSSNHAQAVTNMLKNQVKSLDELAASGTSLNRMAHELKSLTNRFTV
ncbi:MAG: methyl-accepting chemotaxis protein [Clostridia bacterium]